MNAPVRWFYLTAFIFGTGLSNHWETHIIFSFLLFFFFFATKRGRETFFLLPAKLLLFAFSLFILGSSPLLYLPLRAHLHPVINLGAPDTVSHFMAAFFRRYTADREIGLFNIFLHVLDGSSTWKQFFNLFRSILDLQGRQISIHIFNEMKLPASFLACLGLFYWWRSGERKLLWVIMLSFAGLLLALCSALWFQSSLIARWHVDNFLIPTNWLIALLSSIGSYSLLRRANRPSSPRSQFLRLLVFLVIWLTPLQLIFSKFKEMDQEKQLMRYDYGENLLKSTPRGSILFAEGDEDYFPLYYFQNVERKREDVVMIPSFTLFETWGVEQVERLHPELGLTASSVSFPDHFARIIFAASQIIKENRDQRPCCFTYFDGGFHRFYAARHPSLFFRTSGTILELASSPAQKTSVLDLNQLRTRYFRECESNPHASMGGIFQVYKTLGVDPR
jgi:hypothetical protein